ncbi:unnamed protein product [Scytosiphon promiscuus]
MQQPYTPAGAVAPARAGPDTARPHAAAGAGAVAGTTMVAAEPIAGLLKTVTVELGDRSYPIYVGEGILDRYS